MPQIPADPRTHKNLLVRVDGNDYELHVPKVEFTRTPPKPISYQGGTPEAVYVDASPSADHLCNITLVHDYQNPDSAYNVFRDNEGEQVEIIWKPDADGDYTETATITLVAPNPGGAYGAFGESTVACPSSPPAKSFDGAAVPTITTLSPAGGTTAGGNSILLLGSDFTGTTLVTVAGASVAFTLITDGIVLIPAMPAHAAGATNIIATNATGASAAKVYTYA